MFTRTGARPRVFAALTAIVAAAALALLPSLSAAADEGDLAAVTAAAAQARADANAAHGAAAAADSEAASAASSAAQAHADAAAACSGVASATEALAGNPEDAGLQQALANAQAACDAANAAAGSADSYAASAAGAASSAHANADALEQAAVAAEAAAAAAQSSPAAVQKTADDETTTDETTDETTTEEETEEEGTEEEAEEDGTEEEAAQECAEESTDEVVTDETAPEASTDETSTDETTTEETTGEEEATVEEGCGEAVDSLVLDRRQNCDNRDLTFFSQNKDWDWCFPDPKIDIDVESYCPTVIEVEISHLWWWVDYTVKINGTVYPITIDNHGKATITLTDWDSNKVEVKVYKEGKKLAEEKEWLDDKKCPYISTEITQCTTIGGSADVWVYVSDLQWWRDYDITITGPGGTVLDDTISWTGSWNDYFSLPPGSYTVTVFSEGGKHKPDIGPVVYTFEVLPCPGDVTISINPTCAPSGSGSLGATLSGLVPGREYSVTVTGPNGTVTDTTFVASGPTWDVPPSSLPPGTYTVTVVDTASSSGSYALKVAEPEYDPLTWTATGTITSCPALASTGSSPSSGLIPALALIPLGAGLLITSAMRRRKVGPLAEVDEEG